MLRLDVSSAPRWLDMGHGVRLLVRPAGVSLVAAARRDPEVRACLPEGDEEALGVALARALARLTILEWEGVGDESGAPLDVTDEGVNALMEVLPIFGAFQSLYVEPGLMLESEKNASAPSPNGTTAAAETTARPAKGRARSVRSTSTAR